MIAWFLHIVSKDVLNFENFNIWWTNKNPNGRQKFKMAATELKIGQNSPMRTLKLKFEAVVLTDCLFLACNEQVGIPIWSVNIWRTNKIQDGRKKIKMAAKRPKYSNIFT